MRPLSLSVAGLRINLLPQADIVTPDRRMYFLLKGVFGDSLREGRSPKSGLDIYIQSFERGALAKEICSSKDTIVYYSRNSFFKHKFLSKKAFIYVSKTKKGVAAFFVDIQQMLLLAASILGMRHDFVFLHAAAVAFKDKGCLFLGRSGSGKTTLCRRIKPECIYSDDVAMVKRSKNNFYLLKSPFHPFLNQGNLSRQESAKLESVFILRKSGKVSITGMDAKDVLGKIVREGTFFYDQSHPRLKKHIFEYLFEMLRKAPAFKLALKKDSDVYKIITGGLK